MLEQLDQIEKFKEASNKGSKFARNTYEIHFKNLIRNCNTDNTNAQSFEFPFDFGPRLRQNCQECLTSLNNYSIGFRISFIAN